MMVSIMKINNNDNNDNKPGDDGSEQNNNNETVQVETCSDCLNDGRGMILCDVVSVGKISKRNKMVSVKFVGTRTTQEGKYEF